MTDPPPTTLIVALHFYHSAEASRLLERAIHEEERSSPDAPMLASTFRRRREFHLEVMRWIEDFKSSVHRHSTSVHPGIPPCPSSSQSPPSSSSSSLPT